MPNKLTKAEAAILSVFQTMHLASVRFQQIARVGLGGTERAGAIEGLVAKGLLLHEGERFWLTEDGLSEVFPDGYDPAAVS